jgi:hypothetical protein
VTPSKKAARAKPTRPAKATKPRSPGSDAEAHARRAADWDPKLVARLRKLCLAYPEVVEVEQFGGPWFKAGKKAFCAYGAESEKVDGAWRGRDGASFSVSLMDQSELVKDPRFGRTHYIGHHGWTTMRFEGAVDWDEVVELVDIAYRRAANRRMLSRLD